MKDDNEIDEAVEACRPSSDAPLWIGGRVRKEEGRGQVYAAAQDILVDGGGV